MSISGNICPSSARLFAAKPASTRGASSRSERSLKPWLAFGLSKRTYYRRKALGLIRTHQDDAHVAAWFATLSGIARLEHRSFVRRCARGAAACDSKAIYSLYLKLRGAN